MKRVSLLVAISAIAILMSKVASAYLVAFALPLPELAEHSEMIFKGTVVSSGPLGDPSLKKINGFESYETVFRVISVVKGEIETKEVRFRHYGTNDEQQIRMYSPQYYDFELKRSYIVCAMTTKTPAVLRQIWDSHRSKEDQGVLRTADDAAHQGNKLADVYWHTLSGLLVSDLASDAIYAIDQLNAMSGIGHSAHKSFDRGKALDKIVSLIDSPDETVSLKAINSIGQGFTRVGGSMWALFALNPAHFPGHGTPENIQPNAAAKKYSGILIRVAQSKRSDEQRAAAITSLGQSTQPELYPLVMQWITDDSIQVRSAATILLADFADEVKTQTWKTLLADDASEVHNSAIRAIGIAQATEMLDDVTQLLDDSDPKTVSNAAATLLSFPLQQSREILESKIDHAQYGCLFINALAAEETAKYAERLGKIVRETPVPKNWWGGHVTWGISWNLLFKHVQKQPEARLRAGDFDSVLDALESPITEREKSNHYSSSEPRDLYALYVQRGMKHRAKAYRDQAVKKTRYDIDQYFDKVDARPDDFQRRGY